MGSAHYTLIGSSLAPELQPFFALIGLGGLIGMCWKKARLTAFLLVLASGIILSLRPPSFVDCMLLYLLPSVGMIIQAEATPKIRRKQILGRVFGAAMLISCSAYTNTGRDITLSATRLVSNLRGFEPEVANRSAIAAFELTGWHGEICEWRFEQSKTNRGKDPFLANMLETDLFWDHEGHVLSGVQVANRIAAWAGTPIKRRPYAVALN